MKKLLDIYLKINELLDDNNIEIITTKNKFGYGVMLLDKETGQSIVISEKARNHIRKIKKPITLHPTKEEHPNKSLLDQYRQGHDEYALRKLLFQLQPVVEHTINLVNPGNKNRHNLLLKLQAEKELSTIIAEYPGNEADLEHYVVKELRYHFEQLIRDRKSYGLKL